MAFLNFERVNALPATLTASTMYMVKGADASLLELVVAGNEYPDPVSGLPTFDTRHILNKSEITTMISTALADFNSVEVVSDIAARDALPDDSSFMCLVLDATADPSVESGAATYVWHEAAGEWVKVGEMGSLDVTLQWNMIQGRPNSTSAQIDDAVSKAHSHANIDVLNGLSVNGGGNLMFNGKELHALVVLAAAEW